MQILQVVQISFYSIGFSPKLKPLNHRNLSILGISFPGVILELISLICEANGAQEYMESVYIITVCSGVLLAYASTIVVMKKLFSFIEAINEFFNEGWSNLNQINFGKNNSSS